MELSKEFGPPKKRFGPAEIYTVPVRMTTRSQVLLLNSGLAYMLADSSDIALKISSFICLLRFSGSCTF